MSSRKRAACVVMHDWPGTQVVGDMMKGPAGGGGSRGASAAELENYVRHPPTIGGRIVPVSTSAFAIAVSCIAPGVAWHNTSRNVHNPGSVHWWLILPDSGLTPVGPLAIVGSGGPAARL